MLTEKELVEYIVEGKRSESYKTRLRLTEDIQTHSEDRTDLIRRLFNTKYPNEPNEILHYRLSNISHITRTYFNKILITLAKINKSEDFIIKFPDNDFKEYTESTFSLKNDTFYKLLRMVLTEPNGVCLVLPIQKSMEENLNDVFLGYYSSDNVLHISEKDCLVKIGEDTYYYIQSPEFSGIGSNIKGFKKSKKRNNNSLELIQEFEYNYVTPPYFQMGGFQYRLQDPYCFESFISGVIPFWNQALIEFSDRQSGIKQHLFPTLWRYVSGLCGDCNGKGYHLSSLRGNTERIKCDTCNGSGNPPGGMFSEIIIQGSFDPNDPAKPPIPPAGYIAKDFTSIEFLNRDYKELINAGLASINMEFLMSMPLNQSGLAKEWDRSELNSFIYFIASHMINNVLIKMYTLIAQARYYSFDTQESLSMEEISKIIPSVRVPKYFDHITGYYLEEKISKAKSTGMSSYIVASLEKKYIDSNFSDLDFEKKKLMLINKLDPLVGTSIDEKINIYKSNGCTDVDFFVSCNIERIIQDLLTTKEGFYSSSFTEQMRLVYERALEVASNDDVQIRYEASSYPDQTEISELQVSLEKDKNK